VQARGMRIDMPHPEAGSVPLVASPIRLSATPVEYRAPPPLLGQHTREVLGQLLEIDSARIDALAAAGVI
jgi:crotonobetainyl-CoA:carnitine CoA-transferase CaiB-like acyl-CoA transferase